MSVPSCQGERPRRRDSTTLAVVVAVVVACVAGGYWIAIHTGTPVWATPKPEGYYAHLTDAFLAGQTHLKIEPHRGLALLENPYAGYQGIPRLHDATYFDGKYYLYFGTPPVFLIYGPWFLLTGTYLSDGVGTGLFGLIGFLAGAWLLTKLYTWYLSRVHVAWLAGAVLLWGFGSFAQCLPYAGSVYPVPIASAFAFITATLAFLVLACREPGKVRWLIYAGLMWGLAIASRPGYLASLLAALPAAYYLLRARQNLSLPERRPLWHSVAALVMPVALVGGALAWYNWTRFGSILEFGTTYMFTAEDRRETIVTNPANVLQGLSSLLFNPANYSPYFPFLIPTSGPWGALIYCPLIVTPLFLLLIRNSSPSRLFALVATTATTMAVMNLVILSALPPPLNDRYLIDFLPPLLLAALVSGLALANHEPSTSRHVRWIRGVSLLLGLWTLAHSIGLNLYLLRDHPAGLSIARVLNHPASWIERAFGYESGPIRMRIQIPDGPIGSSWPLVTTAKGNDILYLRIAGPDSIEVGFMHVGAGGPVSEPIAINRSVEQTFVVDLGSLYPTLEHPALTALPAAQAGALKRRVRVTMNDQVVLDSASLFHSSSPADVHIGDNPSGIVTSDNRLNVRQVERLGVAEGLRWLPSALPGPLRLQIQFPAYVSFATDPLISTGNSGNGDILYVSYVGENRLRFGHDSWGSGGWETSDIAYDPARTHELEVNMGSLNSAEAGTSSPGPFQLRFDGKVIVATTRSFHASEPASVTVGVNSMGSSAVSSIFTGRILRTESIPAIELPAADAFEYGTLRLTLRFPLLHDGRQEPLLTTGRTGAGDFVFVRYVDGNHIQVGFDHWNAGGPLSDPIEIDFNVTHVVEISIGSLYPAEESSWWGKAEPTLRQHLRSAVEVKINGRIVLTHTRSPHPSEPREITVGQNTIGGSTVEPLFGGTIDHQESLPLPQSP